MNKKKLILLLLANTLVLVTGCSQSNTANSNTQTQTQVKEERIDPDNKPRPVELECCKKEDTVITTKEMSASELNNIQADILEKERYLVIDVRPENDYKKGHLKYAINMPKDSFKDRIGRIRDWSNLNVVIYADNMEDSQALGDALVNDGFLYVFTSVQEETQTANFVTYTNLTGSEFQKLIDKAEGVFLDSRDEKDFTKTHQKNAIRIDANNIDEKVLPKDKNEAIYLYDYTGDSSVIIAEKLQGLGYTNICLSLDGTKENKFYF